jgi:imidazolonepropionase-like amidohydrolase
MIELKLPTGTSFLRLTFVVAVVSALFVACAATAPIPDLALVGGKVYPSPDGAPIENAVVLLRDGSIVAVGPNGRIAIPQGTRTIDCTGKVVTAGFWNSHVHLTEPVWNDAAHAPAERLTAHLREMLTGRGFTTVFDLGSDPENSLAIRRLIADGKIPGPRIFLAGDIFPKDGRPVYLPEDVVVPEAATPAQATAIAKRFLRLGEDGIKVFAGAIKGHGVVVPMPAEIVRAAADVAHAAGKPVFSHPTNRVGVDNSLAGGVDVLAHTAPSAKEFTAGELSLMVRHHVALIPTLALFPDEVRKGGGSREDQDAFARLAIEELRSFVAAGGTVLFGTDVGYTRLYDTTSEVRYMAQAGMSWRQILASLTTSPAAFFKAPHTGAVKAGMDGDLVVLDGDPAADVASFARVAITIRGGKIIYTK